MIEGDFGDFHLENKLVEKLDLMTKRCTGKRNMDNWIILDGDEGYGKTTMSVLCAQYFKNSTGRKFDHTHMFFDVEKLIEFAKNTHDQIIIWDEAALGGLASDWQNKSQKKLIQLSMIVRKRRHIVLLNIPKIFKLQEYLAVDRSICLIHVYARTETELGRFCYYNKKQKEFLYNQWRLKKKKDYRRCYNFHGTFPGKMGCVIDEDEYDRIKDEAIGGFDAEPQHNKYLAEIARLKKLYALVQGVAMTEKAKMAGSSLKSMYNWKNTDVDVPTGGDVPVLKLETE